MILRGSIERFDLGSVLQFLAQNAATGILEIRDYEEHGHIYLVKGRLEAISLPVTDDRLGVFMVKHGLVAEAQLAKVLMEEASGADASRGNVPLGQRLADRGFVTVERRPQGDAAPHRGEDVRTRPLADRRLQLRRARTDARVQDLHPGQRAGTAAAGPGAYRPRRQAPQARGHAEAGRPLCGLHGQGLHARHQDSNTSRRTPASGAR